MGGGRAGEPERDPARVPTPCTRDHHDAGVERQCGGVRGGVDETDTASRTGGVTPVGRAGERGGHGADHAPRDELGGRTPGAAPTDEVKGERRGPEADGEVGEQGVQRVPEPGAAQRVLERLAVERVAHCVGGRVGEVVQTLVGTEPFDCARTPPRSRTASSASPPTRRRFLRLRRGIGQDMRDSS